MGRYSLLWELGGPEVTTRDKALSNFNALLEQQPQMVSAALRVHMNGTTPPIVHEALGDQPLEVDQPTIDTVHHLASLVLDETRDGRGLTFEGGDSAHGEVYGHTNDIRRSGPAMRDLGYAILATSAALTVMEQQAA